MIEYTAPLVQLKTNLINHSKGIQDDIDLDQIEYVIDLIDYILTDRIFLDEAVVDQLMEELVVTSIYINRIELLSSLPILKQLKEEMLKCP